MCLSEVIWIALTHCILSSNTTPSCGSPLHFHFDLTVKKNLLKIVLSWRLFLCWTRTLPTFLPVPTNCDCSLEGQDTLTASLSCLWFYSWKSKCLIHHQETLIKHIKKVKRMERRCIWGWVTGPDTTGSHSILSSGQYCAFDGWLYKV